MNKYNFIRAIIFIIALFYSDKIFSQKAESLYQEYSKFKIIFNYAIIDNERHQERNPRVLKEINRPSYQLGFNYNFYQKGKFSFKTGLIAKTYFPEFSLNLTANDLNNTYTYVVENDHYDDIQEMLFSIPAGIEYIQPITKKINLKLGVAYNLNLYSGDPTSTTKILYLNEDTKNYDLIFNCDYTNFAITSSYDLSAGLLFQTKNFLIGTDFIFTKGEPLGTGNYRITNTLDKNEINIRQLKDRFYAISISLSPKKGLWFKKENK